MRPSTPPPRRPRPRCRCSRSAWPAGPRSPPRGRPPRFAAVKDSRDRFKADLDALHCRRHRAGRRPRRHAGSGDLQGAAGHPGRAGSASTPTPGACSTTSRASRRWPRDSKASTRATTAFSSSRSRRRSRSGRPAAACARSSTRTSSRCCRSGSPRTPTRWPRPTRSIPRSRSCSARTRRTTREILNGLLKGSDTLRLSPLRNEEARATLAELRSASPSTTAG